MCAFAFYEDKHWCLFWGASQAGPPVYPPVESEFQRQTLDGKKGSALRSTRGPQP